MWLSLDLTVQGASAQNAYCIYGHPSPLAFIGFAHALCVRANLRQTSGVLAVFRDYRPRSIKVYGNEQFAILRSAERDLAKESQLDIPRADLEVSVAFEIESQPDFDAERLEAVLAGMRFAGGVLVKRKPRLHDDMAAAIKGLRGFVMKSSALPHSEDPLGALLDAVAVKPKGGWVTPSLRGLRLLETPQPKQGARGAHPHAYADPLLGVVHFEAVRTATESDLWRLERRDNLIRFITA